MIRKGTYSVPARDPDCKVDLLRRMITVSMVAIDKNVYLTDEDHRHIEIKLVHAMKEYDHIIQKLLKEKSAKQAAE